SFQPLIDGGCIAFCDVAQRACDGHDISLLQCDGDHLRRVRLAGDDRSDGDVNLVECVLHDAAHICCISHGGSEVEGAVCRACLREACAAAGSEEEQGEE